MLYLITLEIAEDGQVVAKCPALPGCTSQGRSKRDAIENMQGAIPAWMFAENQKLVEAARAEETSIHYVLV